MDYLAAMRSFTRAAALGSFSRAAAEAGVKVSTISRYVSALEKDVGAALLNRSTHGLHLTEIGRMFFDSASRIVADVDDARTLASSFNHKPQGCLKITVPAAFGRLHVIKHMPDFLAAHPDVHIEVTLTDAFVDLVSTGLDAAIRIGALSDSGLKAKRLARYERLLCASPSFLADGPSLDRPEDIAKHQALTAPQPQGDWHFRHRRDGRETSVKVAGRARINDSEGLMTCALAGAGIAALPTWLVHDALSRGTLIPLMPDWQVSVTGDFDLAVWAVYPPKKIVSPKVKAFIGFFEDRFRRAEWERNYFQAQADVDRDRRRRETRRV